MLRLRALPIRAIASWTMIVMLIVPPSAWSQSRTSTQSSPPTIVFICQHGAAKSVIAAAYFNKLAAERHLNFRAIARGVTPQPGISASTIAGLQKDGVPSPNGKPQVLTREDVQQAARVIAFCPVPASLTNGHQVNSFDVPSPMEAYDQSRDAILVHVRELINQLARARTEN